MGAIGLMIGVPLDPEARYVVVAVAFLVGGFVAGARAPGSRLLHSLIAVVLGYIVFAVFIGIANVISEAGGPDAPEFASSGPRSGVIAAITAVLAAVAGGLAAKWFAPGGRRGR